MATDKKRFLLLGIEHDETTNSHFARPSEFDP